LCVPNDTPYRFEWSCDGDLSGTSCINWNDPDNSIFDNCHLCLAQDEGRYPTYPDDFTFSHGAKPMSYECLDIVENSRGWGTNYFCWKDDSRFVEPGFSFFRSGGIPSSGARCTLLENPADGKWSDNYLCVPNDTPYRFEWSCDGDLSGTSCINWNDPDNSIFDNCHLCLAQLPTDHDHDKTKCVKHAGREYEEMGSCCGTPGEITCESGYELVAPIPDVCGGDCPENWCNHHNPNSPLRMARSYKCVPPQNVCADGYERVVGGDVPMFGEINGKGGRQVVSSCAMCANLCDDEPLCNSYECDTADEFGITCNLNQEAESTTTYCGPICQRQLFCVKQTPTEIMYKALKGCSRNRFHAFQEEVGFYDPSRSVAKIQCCSLDGSTCTRKDSWPHGACLGDREKVTWAQAKQICEAEGMRLCNSQQEVDNCCHRGCGYDGALTWTGIYPGVGSHYAACGRPGRCNAASIVSEDIAVQKVRCVSDSRRPGWFSRPNLCGNLSWESDIWGGCHSLTFQAATEFCASQDARLPTREEAESGCAAASGCGFDAQYIWTSTSA